MEFDASLPSRRSTHIGSESKGCSMNLLHRHHRLLEMMLLEGFVGAAASYKPGSPFPEAFLARQNGLSVGPSVNRRNAANRFREAIDGGETHPFGRSRLV